MKPLIVRITENLKVTNHTTGQLLALLDLNRGDFRGTEHELLLYVSVLVKKVMQECEVFVCHLNDGMRIAFCKEHINKDTEGVIRIIHERLTFRDDPI